MVAAPHPAGHRYPSRNSGQSLTTVPLLIIDDFGMRKLPLTAAEDLLEIVMRRYERAQHATDLQPPGRGLGQAAGRCGSRYGHARSHSASWPRAQVRSAELAHQDGGG